MTLATITALPTAAAAPVVNPRSAGRRPKGVTSLQKTRLDRDIAKDRAGRPMALTDAAQVPGRFNYPKSMLSQEYFCLGGDGRWLLPSMDVDMLVSDRFVSPLRALLDQLQKEGHDVSGARAEWMAFREHLDTIKSIARGICGIAEGMRCGRATLTTEFLVSGRDGL